MSTKSIIFSILSVILFVGIIIGIVFLFKIQFIIGLLSILLLGIPIKLDGMALEASSGTIDKLLAKYVVPVIALIGVVFIVLLFTIWM